MSTRSSRSSSSAVSSDSLQMLRSLYASAARAFLNRSPLVHSYIDRAFEILGPPSDYEALPEKEKRGMDAQRIKWDVLRLTYEASIYPLEPPSSVVSKGKAKAKDQDKGVSPDAVSESTRTLLSVPPAILLPALHARSLVLFTPASNKASSANLPPDVLHALVLFAVRLGLYSVARLWIELWWVVRGPSQRESPEEVVARRKIRECMVLRVCANLSEWGVAESWVQGEPDDGTRLQLQNALETVRAQRRAEDQAKLQASTTSMFSPSLVLPSRTPPLISPASSSAPSTRTPTPSNAPPHRPTSPASSTSSTATHSTHTATPNTPRPARAGLALTPSGIIRGSTRIPASPMPMPMPPPAPPVAPPHMPAPVPVFATLINQLRRSLPPIAWLFVFLLPLVALLLRIRRARSRGSVGQRATVSLGVAQLAGWLWKALRDGVDMAGRGLV